MRRNLEANYFKIGAFLILGLAIIIVALLIFGSGRLFERTVYIETYFNESIQGVSIGTPVKYRGLQIGYVKDIAFTSEIYEFRRKNIKLHNRTIYVKIAVTSKLFTDLSEEELSDFLINEVASGLRIKLAMQGLTGTNYLELNYVDPKQNPPLPIHWKPKYFYVPSATSTIAQLSENVQDILNELKDVDFKKIFADLDTATVSIDLSAKSLDSTAYSTSKFIAKINDPSIATLNNLKAVTNDLRGITEHLKSYPSQIIFSGQPPLLDLNKL